MRWLFSIGYFCSWLFAAALLLFISTLMLWEMANVSQRTGIDDDLTLLALPIGAVLGVWGAARTRHASVLHRVFSICGLSITAIGAFMAIRFVQMSQQAIGSGPFAGIGEFVAAGISIGFAALGVCMFGIWAFARLAR